MHAERTWGNGQRLNLNSAKTTRLRILMCFFNQSHHIYISAYMAMVIKSNKAFGSWILVCVLCVYELSVLYILHVYSRLLLL